MSHPQYFLQVGIYDIHVKPIIQFLWLKYCSTLVLIENLMILAYNILSSLLKIFINVIKAVDMIVVAGVC